MLDTYRFNLELSKVEKRMLEENKEWLDAPSLTEAIRRAIREQNALLKYRGEKGGLLIHRMPDGKEQEVLVIR